MATEVGKSLCGIPIILLDGPMKGVVINIGERMILRQPVTETVVHWYDNDGHFVETQRPQYDHEVGRAV